MKKVQAILLALATVLCFSACGADNGVEDIEVTTVEAVSETEVIEETTQATPELTEDQAKELFTEANKLFVGWIVYGFSAERDSSDFINVNDKKFERITADDYASVDEIKAEAAKYFTGELYTYAIEQIDSYYFMHQEHLYGYELLGQGGDVNDTELSLNIKYQTADECLLSIAGYSEWTSESSISNYKLKYDGESWKFVYNDENAFPVNFGLYNNDTEWVDQIS